MLGMILCIDNLERVRYDIPLIIKNWDVDKVVLFSGSDVTTSILRNHISETSRISIIQIDNRISVPMDIPNMYNKCVDYCYDDLGLDAVVTLDADLYMSKSCIDYIKSYYLQSKVLILCYEHIQLYVSMWKAPVGAILSFKDRRMYRYTNGVQLKPYDNLIDPHDYNYFDQSFISDVGYFTIQRYRDKMYSHNFIWPDPYKTAVVKMIDRDRTDGLKFAYKKIKEYCKLRPIDPETYKEMLDYFQCWEEYEMCKQIMATI